MALALERKVSPNPITDPPAEPARREDEIAGGEGLLADKYFWLNMTYSPDSLAKELFSAPRLDPVLVKPEEDWLVLSPNDAFPSWSEELLIPSPGRAFSLPAEPDKEDLLIEKEQEIEEKPGQRQSEVQTKPEDIPVIIDPTAKPEPAIQSGQVNPEDLSLPRTARTDKQTNPKPANSGRRSRAKTAMGLAAALALVGCIPQEIIHSNVLADDYSDPPAVMPVPESLTQEQDSQPSQTAQDPNLKPTQLDYDLSITPSPNMELGSTLVLTPEADPHPLTNPEAEVGTQSQPEPELQPEAPLTPVPNPDIDTAIETKINTELPVQPETEPTEANPAVPTAEPTALTEPLSDQLTEEKREIIAERREEAVAKNLETTQTAVETIPARADVIYQIQAGDTLSALAQAHQVTVEAIAERNQIPNPNQIISGQTIVIPNAQLQPGTELGVGGGEEGEVVIARQDTWESVYKKIGDSSQFIQVCGLNKLNLGYPPLSGAERDALVLTFPEDTQSGSINLVENIEISEGFTSEERDAIQKTVIFLQEAFNDLWPYLYHYHGLDYTFQEYGKLKINQIDPDNPKHSHLLWVNGRAWFQLPGYELEMGIYLPRSTIDWCLKTGCDFELSHELLHVANLDHDPDGKFVDSPTEMSILDQQGILAHGYDAVRFIEALGIN